MALPAAVEVENLIPLEVIFSQRELNSPKHIELLAKGYLESLLYNKERYTIVSRDPLKNPLDRDDIALSVQYHLVNADGPSPVILVGRPSTFKETFLKSLEIHDASAVITMISLNDEERAVIVRKNGIRDGEDYIFPDPRSSGTDTPTSVANKQLFGKDEIQPGQRVVASVVLLDFSLVDKKALATEKPIGSVNFFELSTP